jgi:hypothetical protein
MIAFATSPYERLKKCNLITKNGYRIQLSGYEGNLRRRWWRNRNGHHRGDGVRRLYGWGVWNRIIRVSLRSVRYPFFVSFGFWKLRFGFFKRWKSAGIEINRWDWGILVFYFFGFRIFSRAVFAGKYFIWRLCGMKIDFADLLCTSMIFGLFKTTLTGGLFRTTLICLIQRLNPKF